MSTQEDKYDVIIVGARCAGATFANYMARAGAKVLLVDKAKLPSDVVLSTHAMHPSGMAVLDDLGVGGSVREVAPEMQTMQIDWDGTVMNVPFAAGHGEYCPRRERLDDLLQRAATAAGADLRDRTQVIGLLQSDGRVSGVKLKDSSGEWPAFAPLVVGADGRSSRVAEWVGATYYYDYSAPRAIYWSYWPAPTNWGKCPEFPAGMYTCRRDDRIVIAFHTDNDQLLMGALPFVDEVDAFRTNGEAELRAALSRNEMLARLASTPPLERPRGYLGERYFFRTPVGPGWLLLGDAGLYKDFLSGDGMSEALLQARNAAHSLTRPGSDSTDRRLQRWALQRDIDALPHFRNTQVLAARETGSALNRVLLPEIAKRPELLQALAETFARQRSPFEVLPPSRVLTCMAGAALRGNLPAIREFFSRGRIMAAVKGELRRLNAQLAHV